MYQKLLVVKGIRTANVTFFGIYTLLSKKKLASGTSLHLSLIFVEMPFYAPLLSQPSSHTLKHYTRMKVFATAKRSSLLYEGKKA
jgi:hypothetical protein